MGYSCKKNLRDINNIMNHEIREVVGIDAYHLIFLVSIYLGIFQLMRFLIC